MQIGLLITNHGKHSDEKLAIATAAQIIQIGADAKGEQAMAARKLENAIIDILEGHHEKVSKHEVDSVTADLAHLSTDLDPTPHIEDPVAEIMAAIKASKFAEWYGADTEAKIRLVVGNWTATNMHMHRDWAAKGKVGHADQLVDHPAHSPDHPHVKGWIERQVASQVTVEEPVAV